MADAEHLRILRKGVEAWNEWRLESRDVEPDLTSANFSSAELGSADLREARLMCTKFVVADLSDANFSDANLTSASLSSADLRSANLSRAILTKADLNGANLHGANLNLANLTGAFLLDASLSGADLRGAGLIHAELMHTDLSNTNLSGADLGKANLFKADLSDANLTGANLGGADLSGAGLLRTNLSGTTLSRVTLEDVDLSQACGLAEARHAGRSGVSTNTLERTAEGLGKDSSRLGEVENFLRAAGVSEMYMELFQASIGQPIEFYSCFISYSHKDHSFARRLYKDLQGRGIRCWLDEHEMKAGERILDIVNNAIRMHDKIILCCSEASLNSWWVKDEIMKAQDRERRDNSLIIVPLDLDGYLFKWDDGLASGPVSLRTSPAGSRTTPSSKRSSSSS